MSRLTYDKQASRDDGLLFHLSSVMKDLQKVIHRLLKNIAKSRNRCNQIPHLTRDTLWESDKNTRGHHTQESQFSPFPAGDHMAARTRQDRIIKTNVKHE